jgi:hypothetical protein
LVILSINNLAPGAIGKIDQLHSPDLSTGAYFPTGMAGDAYKYPLFYD